MFRVRWKESALKELTSLWVSAESEQRRAITQATHQIDQQLEIDPHTKGESRPNGRRILFVSPLAVLFRVEPQRSIVRILQVWSY